MPILGIMYLVLITPMADNPAADLDRRYPTTAAINIACECRDLTIGDDPERDADAAIFDPDGSVCAVLFRD